MLTLYHFPNAICAQKVRVCLAEKGVAWEGRDTRDLRTPEYLALNPGGYVPTLVDGALVLPESRVISEYIDERFDGPALLPTSPFERAQAAIWRKRIDDSLHLSVFTLWCAAVLRHRLEKLAPDELERALPLELTKRERARDIVANGLESRFVPAALTVFDRMAGDLEAALQGSDWIVGDRYSLVDADYTPYLQRLTDLGLERLWSERPALSAWFARVKARPSFSAVLADWLTPQELEFNAKVAARFGPLASAKLAAV